MIEEGLTQKEISEQIGVSLAYVNRITKGREQIVNKIFVRMMDELGYDVELTYRKRQPTEATANRDLQTRPVFELRKVIYDVSCNTPDLRCK